MHPRTSLAAVLAAASFALTPALALGQEPTTPTPGGPSSTPTETTPSTTPAPPPTSEPTTPPSGPDQLAQPAPSPPPPGPAGPAGLLGETPVDVNVLVSELKSRLNGVVGLGYAVSRNGKLVPGAYGGVGSARIASDGDRAFTASTRMEIMSVTKNVTAVALQKLLDARGISVDTPIAGYLPATWSKKGGFRADSATPITFAHLMNHTSGINQAITAMSDADKAKVANTWDGAKFVVGYGATPAARQYKNMNYVLVRVLIAQLWTKPHGGYSLAPTKSDYAARTLKYLNDRVLKPAGIATVTCWSNDDAKAALVYDKDNLGQGGRLVERDGDKRQHCGGHVGLHMSAIDLVRLWSHVRHSDAIIPAHVRAQMFDRELGWGSTSNNPNTGTAGIWWHGGDGFFSGGRESHSCIMAATQGYEIAVVLNSDRPADTTQCGAVLGAFNAARGV